MIVHKGFRYRIYPTSAQAARLCAWENALRFLWNIGHEQRLMALARTDEKFVTAYDQINELTDLRAELPWLADVPRNVCTQLLVDLDRAWQRCFAKLDKRPRWKCKARRQRITESHPKQFRLLANAIRFPKIGIFRAVVHRPLEGAPKTCTVSRDGDQWFASITCAIDGDDPVSRVDPVVAIDRGVVNAVADSDGNIVESPRFYVRAMKKLARAERAVSRKKKGSKNREKAKIRVVRVHRKVRRQREHFIHDLSARYAKSHGTVILEKLAIRSMIRSSSGTVAVPGVKVRQKRGLNRGILDSGWGLLAGALRYKLAWSGGNLIEVPAQYSSQTCSACGHVDAKSRASQAKFECTACGFKEHADVNAAKVLKSRANRSAQPVEGSLKQGALRSRKRMRVVRRAVERCADRSVT